MPRLSTLVIFLMLAQWCAAQPIVFNVVGSPRDGTPAGPTFVDLIGLNTSTVEQPFDVPDTLQGVLRAGTKSWPVELKAEQPSAPATIAAGGFAARSYHFTAPADAAGLVVIEIKLDGQSDVRGAVELTREVSSPSSPATTTNPTAAARPRKPTTNLARARPAAAALERTFANRIAPHEPIYFIYGTGTPGAKFQFSFKYKLLGFDDGVSGKMMRTLQFAFTQRSLWDIDSESSPFYDTSYMPEVIFESLAAEPEASDRWLTWLGYQAAYKHESNGRDGPLSRSLNTVYIRPVFAFGALERWHLLVIPEIWAYVDNLEDNIDLKDYRGYGQLRFVFGRNGGPSLMTTLWAGEHLEHRSVQLDLTLPVKTRLLDFQTYLLVQYFNGYGESLLSYREKTEMVRAGFSFVR